MIASFNEWRPKPLLNLTYQFIAPYWADVDVRGTGQVYYRQTKNPVLLAKATDEIKRVFPLSKNVTVINLLIVTWDAVGYYSLHTDKVTFIMCNLIILHTYIQCTHVFMHLLMYVHMYVVSYVVYVHLLITCTLVCVCVSLSTIVRT